jgi:hypothetical protein
MLGMQHAWSDNHRLQIWYTEGSKRKNDESINVDECMVVNARSTFVLMVTSRWIYFGRVLDIFSVSVLSYWLIPNKIYSYFQATRCVLYTFYYRDHTPAILGNLYSKGGR